MSKNIILVGAVSILSFHSTGFAAETRKEPRPEVFQTLLDCRNLAVPAERLACFDAQVARIDAAESRSEVVVIDKMQIKKARRSLFGLTLPKLDIFGGDDEEKSEEDGVLEATIASAYMAPSGRWVVILEDGAKWIHRMSLAFIKEPRPSSGRFSTR